MKFAAEYTVNDMRYTTVFYARDPFHATVIMAARNMKERLIEGVFETPLQASDLILKLRWTDALHAACWLGMVGCASGKVTGFELLHDQGLVHTLAHLVRKKPEEFDNPSESLKFLMRLAFNTACDLEDRVPGFTLWPEDRQTT